ncbi:hypothetical protein FOA43_002778 [Brettanomyces nanus]|uniref:50S ribosomal protein L10 n=1 Tax=Eeniella nana TaxID=13502 RepID=A0A875S8K2_EENNA|nr:uncharacterized protein FOA43_002778 [Brettanomyces nanus]QPG75424.1 hypothetical protein FOA43_002778 [Brettanomyces nanus]
MFFRSFTSLIRIRPYLTKETVSVRSFSSCCNALSNSQGNKPSKPVKPADSRKTYLMEIYQHFWETNEIVLFAHHNNLLSSDNEQIRKELHKISKDIQFRKLKSSIFRHYLRASNHEDPISKAAMRQVKRKKTRHPLEPLLKGPTALIMIKDLDPKAVKEVWRVLKAQKEKLFLMGGKVGQRYVDLDKIGEFKDLPSLPELRSQLVGLLSMSSGAGIVRALESAPTNLAMTLESRKNEMEKKEADVKTDEIPE